MVPRERIEGKRFALLADTHDDLVKWDEVFPRIAKALGEVDGVIHCGDLCTPAALASLGVLGRVRAVRSAADPEAQPPVLVDGPRVLELGDVAVGVVRRLDRPPVEAEVEPELRFAGLAPEAACTALFGEPVQVCVFGGFHHGLIAREAGILWINPGSPSLAKRLTAAVLTVSDGRPSAALVEIPR